MVRLQIGRRFRWPEWTLWLVEMSLWFMSHLFTQECLYFFLQNTITRPLINYKKLVEIFKCDFLSSTPVWNGPLWLSTPQLTSGGGTVGNTGRGGRSRTSKRTVSLFGIEKTRFLNGDGRFPS
ncbi:unnamed protein product, partial [Nesidiocoris tenuis]